MNILFRDTSVPRYVQLADLLRQRIGRGTWKPGHLLPTLDSLTAEFGVARVTVRQAIEKLTREGLVSPQRGRGTFVTKIPSQDRWLRLKSTLQDLAEVYRQDRPKLTLIEEAAALPTLAANEGKSATRYRYLKRVHSRNGVAYCVISVYLDEAVFNLAPKRFRRETVIPTLLDLPDVKIGKAKQSLTIGVADAEVAGLLDVAVNAPVAGVRRLFNGPDDTVVYLGEITYRGDYVHLEMDLIP